MQEREARETPTQRAGMDESEWEKEGWQDLFLRGTEWWARCLHRCFTSLAGWASRSAASHYKYSSTQTRTTFPNRKMHETTLAIKICWFSTTRTTKSEKLIICWLDKNGTWYRFYDKTGNISAVVEGVKTATFEDVTFLSVVSSSHTTLYNSI